jgi:transposase
MRLTHKAGEKMFVDYAGQTVPVVDPETGEIQDAHIFIAVLGASNYTYAEAHRAEDLPNWIAVHMAALSYFRGVSEIITPDNPEVGVQVVERWILARLRDRIFFGLGELNQTIRKLLKDLNYREMRHLGESRCELFDELHRPALKPLPTEPYEFAIWKKAKVHIDYHVEFEKHYYSVPHELIKEKVWIRATRHTVEIFHKHRRVASHLRWHAQGRHSTRAEHMPANHRYYAEWSPARFLHWAEEIGPQTHNVIEAALNARRHPQQAYRTCLGILSLAKGYSKDRLEAASGRALASGICSYRGIKNILNAGLDQVPLEEPASKRLDAHANIRGSSYYQ